MRRISTRTIVRIRKSLTIAFDWYMNVNMTMKTSLFIFWLGCQVLYLAVLYVYTSWDMSRHHATKIFDFDHMWTFPGRTQVRLSVTTHNMSSCSWFVTTWDMMQNCCDNKSLNVTHCQKFSHTEIILPVAPQARCIRTSS